MDGLRQYILRVICCSFFCGIVEKISGNKRNTSINLILALFMMICVIYPLVRNRELSIDISLDEITGNGAWVVEEAQNTASKTMAASIKEKAQSYILEYAYERGLDINVQIQMTGDTIPVPEQVTIRGEISPYSKLQLSEYIRKQLGISEENQIWIS